jgi:hypothetical protein
MLHNGNQRHFRGFSAALPQVIRRVCTRESTANPQIFRAFSTRFAHDFHQAFTSNFGSIFPQPFRKKSEGNSRRGRKEKGRKASGGRAGVENGAEGRWEGENDHGRRFAAGSAQKVWHVEQSGRRVNVECSVLNVEWSSHSTLNIQH